MTLIKQPRLCPAIVVSGSCTISVLVGAGANVITIPPGTYWADPILSGIVTSPVAGNIDALGVLTNLLDAADGGGTYTTLYASAVSNQLNGWALRISRNAGTFQIRGTNASTNAAGRRFLRFLGYDVMADLTAGIAQDTRCTTALWDPLRAEDGSPDDEPDGMGVRVRMAGGAAYAYDLGDSLLSRRVSLPAMRVDAVKRRSGSPGALALELCFEAAVWPWISKGSPIRYWADKNALQNTYLASAMSATDSTFTTPVASTYANNVMVCVDGEWMQVVSGFGTTTTTVYRSNPVAHSKYAPVSTDFVGTYVLDQSGGNVNMQGFTPKRRSEKDDRWDMVIALDRTAGV